MARFVPKEKLSKKARKELNKQRRRTWDFSPVTKTVESGKRYNRRKNSHDRHEDYGMGDFYWLRKRRSRNAAAPAGCGGHPHLLLAPACAFMDNSIMIPSGKPFRSVLRIALRPAGI